MNSERVIFLLSLWEFQRKTDQYQGGTLQCVCYLGSCPYPDEQSQPQIYGAKLAVNDTHSPFIQLETDFTVSRIKHTHTHTQIETTDKENRRFIVIIKLQKC